MLETESPFIAIAARRQRLVLSCKFRSGALTLFLFCAVVVLAFGQNPVETRHNDNGRSGQNTPEKILSTTDVKKFALAVDEEVYAQPLYVPGFTSNWGVRLVRAGQDPPEISTKGLLLSQNCPKVQWIHSSSARNDSIAERTEVFPKTLM